MSAEFKIPEQSEWGRLAHTTGARVVGDTAYFLMPEAETEKAGLLAPFEENRRKDGGAAFRIAANLRTMATTTKRLFLIRRNKACRHQVIAEYALSMFEDMAVIHPVPTAGNIGGMKAGGGKVRENRVTQLAAAVERETPVPIWVVTTAASGSWGDIDAIRDAGFDDTIKLTPKEFARQRLLSGGIPATWARADLTVSLPANPQRTSWVAIAGKSAVSTVEWVLKRLRLSGKLGKDGVEVSVEGKAPD